MRVPSGEKAHPYTEPVWPSRVGDGDGAGHVPDPEAGGSRRPRRCGVPSGEKAHPLTESVWPSRVGDRSWRRPTSQTRSVLSSEAETHAGAVGGEGAPVHRVGVALEGGDGGGAGHVPDPERLVVGGRDHAGPVGGEGAPVHRVGVALEGGDGGGAWLRPRSGACCPRRPTRCGCRRGRRRTRTPGRCGPRGWRWWWRLLRPRSGASCRRRPTRCGCRRGRWHTPIPGRCGLREWQWSRRLLRPRPEASCRRRPTRCSWHGLRRHTRSPSQCGPRGSRRSWRRPRPRSGESCRRRPTRSACRRGRRHTRSPSRYGLRGWRRSWRRPRPRSGVSCRRRPDDAGAVGGEGAPAHRAGMAFEGGDRAGAGHVPNPERAVLGCRHDKSRVSGEYGTRTRGRCDLQKVAERALLIVGRSNGASHGGGPVKSQSRSPSTKDNVLATDDSLGRATK